MARYFSVQWQDYNEFTAFANFGLHVDPASMLLGDLVADGKPKTYPNATTSGGETRIEYQLDNLCNKPEHAESQKRLDDILMQKLKDTNDKFLPGQEYIKKWSYEVDETGTLPYFNYSQKVK